MLGSLGEVSRFSMIPGKPPGVGVWAWVNASVFPATRRHAHPRGRVWAWHPEGQF